jgi:peptidoglycan/LPS O-acetylase OafA/YrhL
MSGSQWWHWRTGCSCGIRELRVIDLTNLIPWFEIISNWRNVFANHNEVNQLWNHCVSLVNGVRNIYLHITQWSPGNATELNWIDGVHKCLLQTWTICVELQFDFSFCLLSHFIPNSVVNWPEDQTGGFCEVLACRQWWEFRRACPDHG